MSPKTFEQDWQAFKIEVVRAHPLRNADKALSWFAEVQVSGTAAGLTHDLSRGGYGPSKDAAILAAKKEVLEACSSLMCWVNDALLKLEDNNPTEETSSEKQINKAKRGN